MKRTILLSALLAAWLSGSGCIARMNKAMQSWMGAPVADLLAAWGPPTQILDDGRGRKVYCYQSTASYTTPGSATTSGYGYYSGGNLSYQGHTTYDPPRTYTYDRYRMFWVNADGRVYRWSWRGL